MIVARGGPAEGFALILEEGKPKFHVRTGGELATVTGPKRIVGGWHHVVGVLTADKQMRLYVDGERVGEGTAPGLLTKDPAQGLEIGDDAQGAVGDYQSPNPFGGIIDEVRLYFRTFDDELIAQRYQDDSELGGDPMLVVTFDDGSARDLSVHRVDGTLEGGRVVEGHVGRAVQFSARGGGNNQRPGNSLVKPRWTADVPIYVRGMVLAGQNLFIVGPPDIIDEEATFQKLTERDEQVQELLTRQDQALNGQQGGILLAVNTDSGEVEHRLDLNTLPAWDGLSGAQGHLFLSTLDGQVMCFGKPE